MTLSNIPTDVSLSGIIGLFGKRKGFQLFNWRPLDRKPCKIWHCNRPICFKNLSKVLCISSCLFQMRIIRLILLKRHLTIGNIWWKLICKIIFHKSSFPPWQLQVFFITSSDCIVNIMITKDNFCALDHHLGSKEAKYLNNEDFSKALLLTNNDAQTNTSFGL